ncbi:hypothetical protein, partial [Phreatobacter sp.]|uniref:hypothetical protein n=1 Tax=Phreatobacter sp. TaxID=1966341 RepID=UPI0022BBDD1C
DRDPGLVLLQDPDDLLFREAAAPHVLVLSMGQNELQTGLSQRGNVSVITRRGRVCRIAHRLEPDDSIELAVLMSECVESVRYPQMRATINGEEIAVW